MRIIIDIQGCQSEGSRNRGIGRYSLNLISSLIQFYPDNEYILLANSSLIDISSDFLEFIYSKDYTVAYFPWTAPGPFDDGHKGPLSREWLAVQLKSHTIQELNGDLLLVTSFFEGSTDNCVSDLDYSYDLPKIFTILYDLIPLLNPTTYLDSNPDFKRFYLSKIDNLKNHDFLLTISRSASIEARDFLDFPDSKICNISTACDNYPFNSINSKELNSTINTGLLGSFILYVGAGDPRKNLLSLVEAYSKLDCNLIIRHKLVLAGKLLLEEENLIKDLLKLKNIPSQYVVFLGYVSDVDLVKLYRECYLFVFPSIHEGFGLPVLEAMTCGAAVIASNTSSIPEIIGNDNYAFNPLSIDSIHFLLNKALTNFEFYNNLKSNSHARKGLFSWKVTAQRSMNVMANIINKTTRKTPNLLSNINSSSLLFDNLQSILSIGDRRYISDSFLQLISSAVDKNISLIKYLNLNRPALNKINSWLIEGPFDSSYSLAILNREFCLSMSKKTLNLFLDSMDGCTRYVPDNDFLVNNPEIRKIYNNELLSDFKLDVSSRNQYPPKVDNINSLIKLVHGYGWEESQFPDQWVNDFNRHLDGITVMSKFVKKVLIDNGVYIPIVISNLGVDHLDNIPINENFHINDAKSFVFLHISSCFPRKGIDILLKAYEEKFTIFDDVSLVIKTFSNIHNDIHTLLDSHKRRNEQFPHVILLEKEMSDSDIKSLYHVSNALVAPSRGEGFGLPIAEAMKTGLPVITTDFGGQKDFCNSSNCWLVNSKFEYSRSHFDLTYSVWSSPSVQHLSQAMRDVFLLKKDKISIKTNQAVADLKDLTWNQFADQNISFVKKICSSNWRKPSRIAFISTWNSRCGIASYSQNLVNSIDENILVFAPSDENLIAIDQSFVKRSWKLASSNFTNLLREIDQQKISSVVIQFNFGFFDFPGFEKLIISLYQSQIKIILFMHSTIDPGPDKTLKSITNSLKLCHRIFVHTPDDMNRLREIDLIDQVSIFPHGLPILNNLSGGNSFYKKINNLKSSFLVFNRSFNLASFGFCLPNKGFIELIRAVHIMRKLGHNVNLKLYTSIHSSPESAPFLKTLEDLVIELSLSKFIIIVSDYLDQDRILNELSKFDLLVYPYQKTNESSSAAVRIGIASGSPVIVSPLSIFDDLTDRVDKLPGSSVDLIVEGIVPLIGRKDYKKNNKKRTKLKLWKDQHDFLVVARRLKNIIRSLEVNS